MKSYVSRTNLFRVTVSKYRDLNVHCACPILKSVTMFRP